MIWGGDRILLEQNNYLKQMIEDAKTQANLSFQVKEKLFQAIKNNSVSEEYKKIAIDLLCQHKQMFLILRLVRDLKVEFRLRKYASVAARSKVLAAA